MLVVTTQQYRQIEFLRLFKICKDLGLVNKKRKMPSEHSNHDHKGFKSSCKRLLRLIVNYSFKDFNIRGNTTFYFIEIPAKFGETFTFMNLNKSNMINFTKFEDVVNGFELLCSGNESVIPRIPHSINVNFEKESGSGGFVCKPKDNLYQCAKDVLEYNKLWERYYTKIERAVEEFKNNRKKLEKELQKTNQRARETNQRARETNQETRETNQETRETNQETRETSQELFNRALQNLRERRANG